MGKIKVRTLGDEKQEEKEKKKAKRGAEEKKLQKEGALPDDGKKEVAEETVKVITQTQTEEKKKSSKKPKSAKKQHSTSYDTVAKIIDRNKKYSLKEALDLLPKLKRAKFDETVELHINTIEKNVSGNVSLPHGTGKQIKVEIVNQTEDPKHVEEIVKKVEAGKIDFDILIATPDAMPKLARIARFLGPRGLMPNPKNGTITSKPNDIAKKFQGGQINFKTEAKFPILHLIVGKVSFGEKNLTENIKTMITAVQAKNIKDITLKSTMSPAIKVDILLLS
jgi:large subunit ribosomal protein L1